ncbi:MAG: hypothetical protein K6F82_06270 [Sphaerochaetaceae bacterium]|nr:hypothetical protein [Sphaerochaetaceae bacterium]
MKLILGAYSQLPQGSPDEEFEALLAHQLSPLLTTIYNNPEYKVVLKLGNTEFEWFEKHHPEINMLIHNLANKNQLELLSSTYKDSIFSLIPTHEYANQIEKSTTYIRKKIGNKPKGLWCPYQVFKSSLVSVMELSSLEYIIISQFSSTHNAVLFNKPFIMNELGKKAVIFPFSDRFSKEIAEAYRTKDTSEKLLNTIRKTAKSAMPSFSTVMINMNQLMYSAGNSEVFNIILKSGGKGCILPSEYLASHSVNTNFYFPDGIYGRDMNTSGINSLGHNILKDPYLTKTFNTVNSLRDVVKSYKKNSTARTNLDYHFIRCESGFTYIPEYRYNNLIKKYVSRNFAQFFNVLYQTPSQTIPVELYEDCSSSPSKLIIQKGFSALLNPKGSTINLLTVNQADINLVMHNGAGLYTDHLRNLSTDKVVDLGNKTYECLNSDKKNYDYVFSETADLDSFRITVKKHFKFRQASFIVEYEVENSGKTAVQNTALEIILNISMPEKTPFIYDKTQSRQFSISDKTVPLTVSIVNDTDCEFSTREVEHSAETYLGEKLFYQYTQIKFKKLLNLKEGEKIAFSSLFRIDVYRRR